MELYLLDKVSANKEAFGKRVIEIAQEIGVDPSWLMAVMYFESSLNPKAVNKYSNATGLIQFMPTTATGLGTSISALYNMTNLQQLDYVRKYYLPFKNKLKTLGDTYLAVFYPALIGKPGDTALSAKVQEQNPVFKSFWVNGVLVKDSIVNYFLSRFSGLKKKK